MSSASEGGATSTTSTTTTDVTTSAATGEPATFEVHGRVTDGAEPVADAIVMQAGSMVRGASASDGTFSITIDTAVPGTPTIVAAKEGYRTRGMDLDVRPSDAIEIAISFVPTVDNAAYAFGDPGTGDVNLDNSTAVCGHCHTTFVAQFQTSAHAKATEP